MYVDLRGSAARGAGAWAILAVYVLLFKGKAPADAGERPRRRPSNSPRHLRKELERGGSRILLFIFVPELHRIVDEQTRAKMALQRAKKVVDEQTYMDISGSEMSPL